MFVIREDIIGGQCTVPRGGSYNFDPGVLRAANRNRNDNDNRNNNDNGLRVASTHTRRNLCVHGRTGHACVRPRVVDERAAVT